MVSKTRRILSVLLVVMMLLGTVVIATASVSAAAGDTVFCENAAGWSDVYCYMWNSDSDKNSEWPGVKMTKGEGNLWSYNITGNWSNVIFTNNAGAQTADLTYEGHGSCWNNSTNSWSKIDVPDNTTPTTTPSEDKPVTPTGSYQVYFRNTANWGKVNVYMWNDDSDKNSAWPGVAATSLGDNVWMYEANKSFKNVIFNDGATQTEDLSYMGSEYIYDYSKRDWELYDTSKLHIKSFTTDVAQPQYTGVKITLSANAGGGEGNLSYKFSVGSTVISDYSSNSTVAWTPAEAGSFTLKVEVKDTLGEVVSKTMTYEIKDIKAEVKPVIQVISATPSNFENTELKKGTEASINVTAGGGNVGTKLLFYKFEITDPNGKTANVPYYTLKNEYKFTPTVVGTYSITTTVQASDNSFATKTVEYDCVNELTKPGELSAKVTAKEEAGKYTLTASAFGGTGSYTYQFSVNGKVVQNYSNSSTYKYTATEAGTYNVEVAVKDSAGATAKATTSFTVAGAEQPTTTKPNEEVKPLTLDVEITKAENDVYNVKATAAGGEGDYQYQVAVNGAVVQKYSAKNTAALKISADGTYAIEVTVKDASGKTLAKTSEIVIKGENVEIPTKPTDDPVEGINATIKANKTEDGFVQATATATGGSGEYLYQFSVNGQVLQAYSDKSEIKFQIPVDGEFTLEVSVKDADGTVATDKTPLVIIEGVPQLPDVETTDPDETTTAPIETTTPGETTTPDGEYLKGDADCNGKVNVKDATIIQKHVAKMLVLSNQGLENAEVDGNGNLNIKDATTIQKFVAQLIKW